MGFLFGEYFLDVDRRELQRDEGVVRLAPQVFDLLLYLLRNRNRVVTKDDLLETVWGGRIVSKSALTTRINAARRAIGDSGGAQQLIRTLPRKGFRFIGGVREVEAPFEALANAPPRNSSRPVENLAERRHLVVMSCNLAELASLASRLDPEDLRELIVAYHQAVSGIVCRFGGIAAKHASRGELIYFGYPRAREDDAERAVRCALVVADTVIPLEPDEELRTCVGIATGVVVVGDPTDDNDLLASDVVGEAPGLAVSLQQLAAPGSVLITESTRRLVGGPVRI